MRETTVWELVVLSGVFESLHQLDEMTLLRDINFCGRCPLPAFSRMCVWLTLAFPLCPDQSLMSNHLHGHYIHGEYIDIEEGCMGTGCPSSSVLCLGYACWLWLTASPWVRLMVVDTDFDGCRYIFAR